MYYYDDKTIAMSSKERDKSTKIELEARGWTTVSFDVATADYQMYGLPGGIRVERKKDLSELIKSFAGTVRQNSEKECKRAHSDGTPLVYVIGERVTESGVVINDIWDIIKIKRSDLRSVNRREPIQTAVEYMQQVKDLYGVTFIFVGPGEVVGKIEDLYAKQPGTIWEILRRRLPESEVQDIITEFRHSEKQIE